MNMDFSEARTLKRFHMLDASRGLACIGVVAMHCHLQYLFPWFWGVMDFFFVMSGLLITRSLISNCDKGRGTGSFLLYRALRLLPAYLAVIVLYALAVSSPGARNPADVMPFVFLYQHTDLIFGPTEIFPRVYELLPYWSLILEEHYYIVWGLIFCVFAYHKFTINPLSLAIIVGLLFVGLYLRKKGMHYWTLPGRFDAFLVGSVMGIILFMPKKVRIPDKWALWMFRVGWLVVIAAAARLLWRAVLSYGDNARYVDGVWLDVSCYTIVSVVLVLGLVRMDIRRMYFGRLQDGLAFIGLISYEIYLVHFPVVALLKYRFDFNFQNGGVPLFLITMILSSVIAYFMHRTLTVPALKRREEIYKFFITRPGKLLAVQTSAPAAIRVDGHDLVPIPCEEPARPAPDRNS
jgi:peptidoglycan/LPS O-acetylase OafA/YrhL